MQAQTPLRVVGPFEITSLEPSRAGYNFTRIRALMGPDLAAGRVATARPFISLTTHRFTLLREANREADPALSALPALLLAEAGEAPIV